MSDDNNQAVEPVREVRPVDALRNALERMKPQFNLALPKHLSADRLVRIAMTSVQRQPKLLECDRASFFGAIMTCAQLGLEPDGILGQAYLIPYGKSVQFVPGYRGLIALARNSGEISYIAAHEVRENDHFAFDFASGEPPVHRFDLKKDRGEVIAFYAIAKFRDGSFYWDMMRREEVDAIRDDSDGYRYALAKARQSKKDPDTPWVQHYVEMGKKTVLRRIAKYLPLSVQKAAEIDAAVNAGMRVTLDKFGDVVIDGDGQVIEEGDVVAESKSGGSKLEQFEEKHSGKPEGGDPVSRETEGEPTQAETATEVSEAAEEVKAEEEEVRGETVADSPAPDPQQSDGAPQSDSAPGQGELIPEGAPPGGDPRVKPKRDPAVWERKDGKRLFLSRSPEEFVKEAPIRLRECRTWADTEDLERHNGSMIRALSTEHRVAVAAEFAKRREELRGA